jgi:hypothetical protein
MEETQLGTCLEPHARLFFISFLFLVFLPSSLFLCALELSVVVIETCLGSAYLVAASLPLPTELSGGSLLGSGECYCVAFS